MEMNQGLFDECTVRYKDERQRERAKIKEREEAWAALEQAAIANAEKIKAQLPSGNNQYTTAIDNEDLDGVDPEALADTIKALVSVLFDPVLASLVGCSSVYCNVISLFSLTTTSYFLLCGHYYLKTGHKSSFTCPSLFYFSHFYMRLINCEPL